MSINTNTDLTEEDASDLQFPKERSVRRPQIESCCKCVNCAKDLSVVYIMCEECDVNICTACFASGAEFSTHRSDHSYRVSNDKFVLFEGSDWTAGEELTLIKGLITLGNWNSVAAEFSNRSLKEIKEHYEYFYIHRHGSLLLPEFLQIDRGSFPEPVVPYRFRTISVLDPPRHSSNSPPCHSLAGYNAARSDFEQDYDPNAEDLISKFELPDATSPFYNVITALQTAVINCYNNRLRERMRRKAIIRNHGLIMLRKVTAWLHRFDTTITQNVYDRLIRFMQFYAGNDFEYFMEGLHRAGELKIQISRLCEFHKKGVTTLEGANLYINLKRVQEQQLREVKSFQSNSHFKWQNKHLPPMIPAKKRSVFTPLDIVGLPGFEKLDVKERELCKTIRLVPIAYIELKDTLVQDNNKNGHLKLLTARRLLKIDVNKTRRLYDFLVQEGYVNKPNK